VGASDRYNDDEEFDLASLADPPLEARDKASTREKVARSLARWEREKQAQERRDEREQRQRDMGIGYLVWAARRPNRISQRELARRIGVSASALCRWECGTRVPSLRNLQLIAQQNRFELMVGLWDPRAKEVKVLGIVDNELPAAELDLIEDGFSTQIPRPTPWRERMGF
jgi:transcriptional regulator with XRE-family HTH domain